jgi:hypothetical protein
MKIALIVIVAVPVAVLLVGAALPKGHVASRSIVVKHDPQSVYAVVRDIASQPQWRSDVQRMEMLGATSFREHGKHGAVTYAIDEDQPPHKLVTRIVDQNLGYSGRWTYAFDAAPEGTRVTITENGEVSNLLFRFMSRFVFGHTATIEKYLSALEAKMRA